MVKIELVCRITHDVSVTVLADTITEAKEMVDLGDASLDFCDEGIEVTSCCQAETVFDSENIPAENKWNEMSRLERAIVLKDNGVSDDCAIEVSGRDELFDIDEEWWGYFDEE